MKYSRLVGCIHNVIEPAIIENGFDSVKSKNKLKSPSGKSGKPGKSPSKSDIILLSDEEGKNGQSEVKNQTTSKKSSNWPDAKSYQYVVKLKHTRNTPSKTPEIITVKQSCIR